MLGYNDITYCWSEEECENTECIRHMCHVPKGIGILVSMAMLKDSDMCEGFKPVKK
jgi:hypothetical protein